MLTNEQFKRSNAPTARLPTLVRLAETLTLILALISALIIAIFHLNYRPISILTTLSKILERAVHHQLCEHLNRHNLLSDEQFGFRPKHSTITAISSL